jgi:hypothetical protein
MFDRLQRTMGNGLVLQRVLSVVADSVLHASDSGPSRGLRYNLFRGSDHAGPAGANRCNHDGLCINGPGSRSSVLGERSECVWDVREYVVGCSRRSVLADGGEAMTGGYQNVDCPMAPTIAPLFHSPEGVGHALLGGFAAFSPFGIFIGAGFLLYELLRYKQEGDKVGSLAEFGIGLTLGTAVKRF